MNLHQNPKLYRDTLRATSDRMGILLDFIEKDYWITLLLSSLSTSEYSKETVFKGGTSLSKAYRLIDRFSEDVDIAVVVNPGESGNQVKTRLSRIGHQITQELTERTIDGITSKGSRYRRAVIEFTPITENNTNNKIIVEVNSFANPFPYSSVTIQSMVGEFLTGQQREDYIHQFGLQPFKLNVLDKRQTLLEKLVSLVRHSHSQDVIGSLSGRIRHFYDLYFLMNDRDCLDFVNSEDFKPRFNELLQHDKLLFDDPQDWAHKSLEESPLIISFNEIWGQLKGRYNSELSSLAYRQIPDEDDIASMFIRLTGFII